MRYAVFTDIHANLEALEAVLDKIDEIAREKPTDEIWFLGDLVGYGPNPNECITILRKRTDVIIAGNHDWAAVGKIDLEDFSAAARISAEWTAKQLTEEHHTFLTNLPERLEIDECTLVHGSPYGPLWEYLTSEVLAERSFQYFNTRYCFVGHTHVPVIFQQPDTIATAPTLPLVELEQNGTVHPFADDDENASEDSSDAIDETASMATLRMAAKAPGHAESAYADPETGQAINEADANAMIEAKIKASEQTSANEISISEQSDVVKAEDTTVEDTPVEEINIAQAPGPVTVEDNVTSQEEQAASSKVKDTDTVTQDDEGTPHEAERQDAELENASTSEAGEDSGETEQSDELTPETTILNAEDRLSSEIEELLTLLGLSESMIQVTNEMIVPPEGYWEAPEGYRAIINPGGVGQPRDGDPRAAFMIYDTEAGFEFYRVHYAFNKTQEKIVKAGLPQYLALRLAYGR